MRLTLPQKALNALLSFVLVVGLAPTVAWADVIETPEGGSEQVAELAGVTDVVATVTKKSSGTTTITEYATLESALEAADEGDTVTLKRDITVDSQINLDKAITFDGDGMTITRESGGATAGEKAGILVTAAATVENLIVSGPNGTESSWDEGEFGIKLYNAQDATLTDVTVTDANAGVQVNGGSVVMTGAITVSGNEFGGIELCHDGALDLSEATLVNDDETDATPVLWNDDTKGTITFGTQALYKKAADTDKDHYYLTGVAKRISGETASYYKDLAEAVNEAADGDVVTLLADDTESVVVSIAADSTVTLNLNGKTLTAKSVTACSKAGEGTLVITDSTDTPGTISSRYIALDVTAGTACIQKGTFSGKVCTEVSTDSIEVTGGAFSVDPSQYVCDGYKAVYDATSQLYTVVIDESTVATVGSTRFADLQSAIDYAASIEAGATVLLSEQYEGGVRKETQEIVLEDAVTVPAGADITVDLNGVSLKNADGIIFVNQGTLCIADGSSGLVVGDIAADVALLGEQGSITRIEGGNFVTTTKDFYKETGATVEIAGGYYATQPASENLAHGYNAYQVSSGQYAGKWTARTASCQILTTSRSLTNVTTVAAVSGGGVYASGSTVNLSAPSVVGYDFKGWVKATVEYAEGGAGYIIDKTLSDPIEYVSTDTAYAFEAAPGADGMPVAYMAVYGVSDSASFKLSINATKFDLTLGDSETVYHMKGNMLNKECKVNITYTVTYTGTDKFLYWTNDAGNIVSKSVTFTSTLVGDTELHAYTNETGDEEGSTVAFTNNNGQLICSQYYTKGTDVVFPTSNPTRIGYNFNGWYLNDTDEATPANVKEKLGTENNEIIVVKAHWVQVEDAVVVTVAYEGVSQEGKTFAANRFAAITITAEPEDTEVAKFLYWKDSEGQVLSYNRNLFAKPSADEVTYTAVYGNEQIVAQPIIRYDYFGKSKTETKYQFNNILYYEVPEGCTITEFGFVGTKQLITEASQLDKTTATNKVTKTTSGTYGYHSVNINVSTADAQLFFRAYLDYTDAQGNTCTIYSNDFYGGVWSEL